jgi:spoIIIJ-associated protein
MGFFDKFKKETTENTAPTPIVKCEPRPVEQNPEKKLSKKEISVNYIQSIVAGMGISPEMEIIDDEKGVTVIIKDDSIVGKNGEVIDAIQYLTSTIVNRREADFFRISVDAGNYRVQREEVLDELTKKISSNVIRTGTSAAMLPMNAYERRVIHSKIADIEGVYSKSVGIEPNRKVVIYPVNKKEQKPVKTHSQTRTNTNNRRDSQKRTPREYVPRPVRPLDIGSAFERDFLKKK